MSIITSITKQKRGERVNIFLDGEFYCGLDGLTMLKYGLKEGKEIDKEEIDDIHIQSEKQRATDNAFAYATKYFKTEKKVRQHLIDKGYLNKLVDEIIEKLKDYGYVDDEKYASTYVQINAERKGINRIKADLLNSGISPEIVSKALEELDNQYSACIKYAKRYASTHNPLDKNKLMRHLYSKGFSFEDIKRACNNLDKEDDEL